MKLTIKDLGAIKEGHINLSKKLNVFCGPNGTGKTYMAYAVYGLLKTQLHIRTNEDMVKELLDKKKVTYKIEFDVLNKYREDLIINFKEDLDGLFGIGGDLAKQYFGETSISFSEDESEFKRRLINSGFESIISIRKIDINIFKQVGLETIELQILDKTISNEDVNIMNFFLYSSILSLLSTHPISSSFILPVERNSIFTFSKELSINKQEAVDHFHAMTSKKNNYDKFEIFFKKTTRYPLPIKDGLMIADDLAEIKKSVSKFHEFAIEIENELLHGNVQINNDGEIQFKPEKSPKRLLPIHLTASIIKSLSSLVIYLKHIAQKNDLIIIDEPEVNLHPDNQIILTKLFARLINKDFRVLISTHSDYVVREINNLIMLSSEKMEISESRKKFGYRVDEFILPDDIEVHYFDYPKKQRGNKKVTVKNLELSESGFEIPSVDETIEKQNSISEELFYSLKY